jgi:hypothetical protein
MTKGWRARHVLFLVAVAFVVAACAPSVVIKNETTFGIVVVVSGGSPEKTEAFRPSPGESSSFEFGGGQFAVVATLDADWVTSMSQIKGALNALIADFEAHQVNLNTDQVEQIFAKLRDIDATVQSYAAVQGTSPSPRQASCNGSVTSNSEGEAGAATVRIGVGSDHNLYATC